MIPVRDFIDYFVDGEMHPWSEKFLLDAAVYFITGVVAGYATWSSMEDKYADALRSQSVASVQAVNSAPGGRIKPR
jgi:fluoride ion exporter CrcB/FEX